MPERSRRMEGYLPIREYAALGDGRTMALVGSDGSVDWLCLPDFDDPFVLGRLVDADRGGRFTLSPTAPYEVERRYVPRTNVLETTFSTASGRVRVTDALTLSPDNRPVRELARAVEGLDGDVELEWRVAPRFAHTRRPAQIDGQNGAFLARRDGQAVVVQAWDAGRPAVTDDAIHARFTTRAGDRALVTLAFTPIGEGPPPVTERAAVEQRLEHTVAEWRRWAGDRSYDGPWKEEVLRSALVLRMLTDARNGAVLAAPTTGLPERIGGSRNFDYRFCWLRDSSFAIDALMRLGDDESATRFMRWVMEATRTRHPRLSPFYRLDGTSDIGQEQLDLHGYRGSQPVLLGNGAAGQRQLGTYGDLFQTATLHADRGYDFEGDAPARLAEIADQLCDEWMHPDSGIWELGDHAHYTTSKMLSRVALDRAVKLAGEGKLPADRVARWRAVGERIREFVEARCWSEERGAYAQAADGAELDAGVLLGVFFDYDTHDSGRFDRTVDRLREELGAGPLLYRYSGMSGQEGAFLACSFWLAQALARLGRVDEAEDIMEGMLPLANDVGLLSEEMDPGTHEMLGNFPQGLTHLALVNAAVTIAEAR